MTYEIETLAAELHRNYRAAEKALNTSKPNSIFKSGEAYRAEGVTLRHDHGWAACHRQEYFLQRAKRILKEQNTVTRILKEQNTVTRILKEQNTATIKKRAELFSFDEQELAGTTCFDIEQLAALFQVPVRLLGFNTGDAAAKAKRDAEIRKEVFGQKRGIVKRARIPSRLGMWSIARHVVISDYQRTA